MKVSEFKKKLEEIEKEHGDLKICFDEGIKGPIELDVCDGDKNDHRSAGEWIKKDEKYVTFWW